MATSTSSMTSTTTIAHARRVAAPTSATPGTRMLLACGTVFGPLFYVVAIVQMAIRPGFDLHRHAISLLSLGDLGWIQNANFLVTGVLAVLGAVGLRRLLRGGPGGTWGPVLIGLSGLAMVLAAFVHPDPGLSFPPGAPAGMPATMSGHAMMHMVAFLVAFLSLVAACFGFLRRFAAQGRWGWALYCVATGLVSPVLIGLGMSHKNWIGVFMALGVAVVFGWVAAIAIRFVIEPSVPRMSA